jgi:hypothetical protein
MHGRATGRFHGPFRRLPWYGGRRWRAVRRPRASVGGDPDLLDGPWLRDAHGLNADPKALTADPQQHLYAAQPRRSLA